MQNSARLFHCARCRCQVVICSHCDRGQIYCGTSCSHQARRQSQRAAAQRYQRSYAGRLRHAQRQRLYRRRSQKVTHQGSPPGRRGGSLPLDPPSMAVAGRPLAGSPPPVEAGRCRFCARPCSGWLRLGFVRRRTTRRSRLILDTGLPP